MIKNFLNLIDFKKYVNLKNLFIIILIFLLGYCILNNFNNIEGNPPTVKSDKKANNNSKNAASKGGIYI